MSNRDLVDRFLATSTTDISKLPDFYAEDAVIEMPFAPPGVPRRSQGRETLRARLVSFSGRRPWTIEKPDSVVVHETTDPDVIVVEYDLHGTVVATGAPLVLSYVMVMTIKDGLITHSRDYSDTLSTLRAVGGEAALKAALERSE
jgi:hypothetical protein